MEIIVAQYQNPFSYLFPCVAAAAAKFTFYIRVFLSREKEEETALKYIPFLVHCHWLQRLTAENLLENAAKSGSIN